MLLFMTRLWPKKNKYQYAKKQTGFTLIELLIVIAVVAILAQVGFASYVTAVQKSYRYEVQQSMIELAQKQERYYSRQGIYSTAMSTSNIDFHEDKYTLSFKILSENEYTISAQPKPESSQADDACGTLTLNFTGEKEPDASGCWK